MDSLTAFMDEQLTDPDRIRTNSPAAEMQAAFQTIYGIPGDLQCKSVPRPKPEKHEVLIKVGACTVNRSDLAMVTAIPFIMRFGCGLRKPKKNIPGTDFSGVVVQIGSQVTTIEVGDHVLGFDDRGVHSQAEYLTIPADGHFIKIPQGIPFDEIVACAEGAHYARNFLNKVTVLAGHKAMVNGGTGAIGSAMIQLLVAQDVLVTAVCRAEHFDLVRSLGATHVIDYLTEDFTQSTDTFNYVFDAVGKSSFFKCRHLLHSDGAYISSELGALSQNIWLSLVTPLLDKLLFWRKNKKVRFPLPYNIKKSLSLSLSLFQENKLKAVIDRIYPLNDIVAAYEYVRSGQKVGNVVLRMGPPDNTTP